MADIALVFNWPPDVMSAMYIEELIEWRELARRRYQADE